MTSDEDPIDRLKNQLRDEIVRLVGGWGQMIAARRIGIDQPRMSDLRHGRLDRLSLERLIRCLALVDYRVDFTITCVGRPKPFMFVPRASKPK